MAANPTSKQMAERKSYYEDDDVPEANPDRTKTLERIDRLAASLIKKRDLAVTARASSGIERIWREDELAFEGVDEATRSARMIDYATQDARPRTTSEGPRRSEAYINIIRPKCETAEGRFADVQLPTDDRNWGLKVTPVAELVKAVKIKEPAVHPDSAKPRIYKKPDGGVTFDETDTEATVSDVAKSEKQIADDKMLLMQDQIDDQLTECDFNGECRKVIQDAVRAGTGIIKGPFNIKEVKKSWSKMQDDDGTSVHVLKASEDQQPAAKRCDYWDIFPDPDCKDDTTKAGYMWEREAVLPRELRMCIGVKGYLSDRIRVVLEQEPQRVTVASPKDNQFEVKYNVLPVGSVYERWTYSGDLDREDLEAMSVDVSSTRDKTISASVVMVNDIPIKAILNPIDTGENIYDFFQWTKRAGVPWGMGVAREMMWQQRIIVAAWRAMMDNAGDSSGANVVIGKGVQPADGSWELTGKKLWYALGEQDDVQKAFKQFQLINNQEDLQRIIELALRFIDMETSMPMLFTGEKGELPETLGATNIMVDSSNVSFRARIKLWDDRVTRRIIKRFYDWNMQYNPKEDIKGDYKVDPRGISALLEKDQQAQSIEELMSLRDDPKISAMVDWIKAIKKYFTARNLDILHPEDKINENLEKLAEQPPPVDPSLEAAKIRSEAELSKAQLVQQAQAEKLQFEAQEATLDRQHERDLKVMDRDIKAMELSASTGVALDKIKAQLSEVAAKLKTQVALAKDKDVKPAEQVAEPIAEPAGRAPEGEAFQK